MKLPALNLFNIIIGFAPTSRVLSQSSDPQLKLPSSDRVVVSFVSYSNQFVITHTIPLFDPDSNRARLPIISGVDFVWCWYEYCYLNN